MRLITITIKEYSELSGYSVRNVTQHIGKGTLMPYMRGIRKSGSTWLCDVDQVWYDIKKMGENSIVGYYAKNQDANGNEL